MPGKKCHICQWVQHHHELRSVCWIVTLVFLVWGGNTVGVVFQVVTGVDCELRKKHTVWDDNYRACSWKWKMRGELDLKYVTGWHAAMKGFSFRCLLQITSFIGCLVFSSLERHWNCCSSCQRMLSVCGWPGRFHEVMNLIIRKDTRIPPLVTGHNHKESVRWRCVSGVHIVTYCVWKLRVRAPCEVTSVTFIVLLACRTHCMWRSSVHLDSIGLHCTVLCSLHNSHTHTFQKICD
jgi:hypothetical protein